MTASSAHEPVVMEAARDLMLASLARRGISRTELARRLGVSQPYVTALLSGRTNFTISTLSRVLAVLDERLVLGLAGPGGASPSPTDRSDET